MPMIKAYEDIDPSSVVRSQNRGADSPANDASTFFRPEANQPNDPTAFLVRMHSKGNAHYHGADEFQIVVEGKGVMGRHEMSPITVHFARGYTPYGPLIPDKDVGWGFLTLRTRLNPVGTQRLPGAVEKLKQMPDRKPWQASAPVSFEREGLAEVPQLRNDEDKELFVKALKLEPGASLACPAPAGDGQFIVVTKGSLMYEGREHRALVVVFLRNDETAFTAQAGSSGLEALVLNMPKPLHPTIDKLPVMACTLCSFAYDPTLGIAADGIRPETPWEEIPATWTCPDCGASKDEFEEVEL